jgi:dihydrolipoamide dehydrogenase
VEGILSHPDITLVREKAAFVDAQTVNDYTAPHIIIATGSETKWLPIEGVGTDPRVVDSTGLLSLEYLPKRLAIIGAGVIGMEFASVFHRFGSEVTVIEFLKECLPALDSDIAKRLRKLLEKRGVTFKMKTAVSRLADIDADVILMATGRKPRTDGLHLEATGITLAPNGVIPVDANFKAVGNIYAIGDVNGLQMLAHAAEMQAVRAVNHILGKTDGIRFDIMPAAIFTEPEAACVGPTEDLLKAQGIAYECKKSFWRANGKALAMGATEGLLKLFVSSLDGRLLGCHAYGAHAADIVQELSVLMCRQTTVSELADMVHIHPTLSEILRSAAEV